MTDDPPRDQHGHPLNSVNSEVAALPRYRHPLANVRGVPLLLPRCGLTVVPIEDSLHTRGQDGQPYHRPDDTRTGGWYCRVIDTDPVHYPEQARSTPVGGYDISVGYEEIATGVEVPWREAAGLIERLWPR